MMSPPEGLKHLNGETSEEGTILVVTKEMEGLYSPDFNKGG